MNRLWRAISTHAEITGRHATKPGDVLANLRRRLTSDPGVFHGYAALRSSLRLAAASSPLKSLLFTSAQPAEGKTTTLLNLGLTMMAAGQKVLIIDADVRKPRIHDLLELSNSVGLTDILTAGVHPQRVVQVLQAGSDGIPGEGSLGVIPSGKGSPAATEAIRASTLQEPIRYLVDRWDVVLIDSSPVLAANDPILLAPLVDGIVFVVRTGVAQETQTRDAKTRLEQAGGRIVGVVMNCFDPRRHGPGTHPYASYYYA